MVSLIDLGGRESGTKEDQSVGNGINQTAMRDSEGAVEFDETKMRAVGNGQETINEGRTQ